jgi:hypothetical protein
MQLVTFISIKTGGRGMGDAGLMKTRSGASRKNKKKMGNTGVGGFLLLLKSYVHNFSAYFLHGSLQKKK